jgi:hypothetical protein
VSHAGNSRFAFRLERHRERHACGRRESHAPPEPCTVALSASIWRDIAEQRCTGAWGCRSFRFRSLHRLAFKKDFLIAKGACPVFYVTNDSPTSVTKLRPNKIKDLAIVCRPLTECRPPIRPPKHAGRRESSNSFTLMAVHCARRATAQKPSAQSQPLLVIKRMARLAVGKDILRSDARDTQTDWDRGQGWHSCSGWSFLSPRRECSPLLRLFAAPKSPDALARPRTARSISASTNRSTTVGNGRHESA